VQPLKRSEKNVKASNTAQAAMEEYERLLAMSFTEADPNGGYPSRDRAESLRLREQRIRELHDLLFEQD
jgi:hypothetical protein